MVNERCHKRLWQNKRCLDLEATCRAEAYNRLVDAVQQATNLLIPRFLADPGVNCSTIEVGGITSQAWNIYKEDGCNVYQIDLTADGLLVEGVRYYSEPTITRRVLNICHIESCDSIAHLDSCFSLDMPDYQTMLYLCDRVLGFCTKFDLCDCMKCMEERLFGLPLETLGKLQFQMQN